MAEYAPLSEDMEPPRRIPRGRRASTVSRPIVRTSVSMVGTRPTLYPSTGQPHFDLVLILPIEQDPAPGVLKLRRSIPARARHIGMECLAELSRDEDEVLLMFSATDDLMEAMAEQLTMEKRLEPKSERSSSKFKSHDPREDPQLSATEGYTDFRIDEKHRFEADSKLSFFSSLERIRLLQALLELPVSPPRLRTALAPLSHVPTRRARVDATLRAHAACGGWLRVPPREPAREGRDKQDRAHPRGCDPRG